MLSGGVVASHINGAGRRTWKRQACISHCGWVGYKRALPCSFCLLVEASRTNYGAKAASFCIGLSKSGVSISLTVALN